MNRFQELIYQDSFINELEKIASIRAALSRKKPSLIQHVKAIKKALKGTEASSPNIFKSLAASTVKGGAVGAGAGAGIGAGIGLLAKSKVNKAIKGGATDVDVGALMSVLSKPKDVAAAGAGIGAGIGSNLSYMLKTKKLINTKKALLKSKGFNIKKHVIGATPSFKARLKYYD